MPPVGMGGTVHQALAKLAMRAAGDQAKTACGNIQLCTGLEDVIEGATHTVRQRQVERARYRYSKEEARRRQGDPTRMRTRTRRQKRNG